MYSEKIIRDEQVMHSVLSLVSLITSLLRETTVIRDALEKVE